MEMSRLTGDGATEPVSRDQIPRHERGQGKIHVPCSADHEQDWQPYPVDPYSCYMCYHIYHGDNPLFRPTGIQIATKSYTTLQAIAPTNVKTVYIHIYVFFLGGV